MRQQAIPEPGGRPAAVDEHVHHDGESKHGRHRGIGRTTRGQAGGSTVRDRPRRMIDSPSVDLVATVMRRLGVWWAVGGGWAIDLWLDEQTREHHDVEVAVRRDDQTRIWEALHDDWELLCLDP